MSETNNKLLQRATYLRNLLIAHVTGRKVNESDYYKLRHYFMGHADTSALVPSIVVEHSELASLWQSLKYSCGTLEDRKIYISDQFEDFISALDAYASPEKQAQSHKIIDESILHKSWNRAIELQVEQPESAVEQMRLSVEQLCYQLLRNMKVVPNPMQHNIKTLVGLTERSLMLSPGKKYYHVIKELLAGCEETLTAIESFRSDRTHINNGKIDLADSDSSSAKILVSLYGSLGALLLSSWRVREILVEGDTSA